MCRVQGDHAISAGWLTFFAGLLRVRCKISPYTDITGFKNA
jgi:hypothetical protein